MIDNMIKENWRYAKRQMTWFKRDKNIIWINKSNNIFEIIKKFKI